MEPTMMPTATAKRWRFRVMTKAAAIRLAIPTAALGLAGVWCYAAMIRMPGQSFAGPLPELTAEQAAMRDRLRADLQILAGDIGERNLMVPEKLQAAAAFIERSLADAGYAVERQTVTVHDRPSSNLVVEIPGSGSRRGEIVVVGAHYDTVWDCPGADDNGSGVVAVLEFARAFAGAQPDRTLRFALFTNEEPPYFQVPAHMGSAVYAQRCKERDDDIVAMISLDAIGYYSDESGSQTYPPLAGRLYPSEGDFIAFISDLGSRALVRDAIGAFREHARFPSHGAALPGWISAVGWSDHWSFWQQGYPAIMVTDTAPFRNRHYHTPRDTVETIDFDRLARVVDGLRAVTAHLVGP